MTKNKTPPITLYAEITSKGNMPVIVSFPCAMEVVCQEMEGWTHY